jgi:SAM-dependent methyltransferase
MVSRKKEGFVPPSLGSSPGLPGKLRNLMLRFLGLQYGSVYSHFRKLLPGLSGDVLEVGPGNQPYRSLLDARVRYRALEWSGARKQFRYDRRDVDFYPGGKFPYKTASFDGVFHSEVLEHVDDPRLFLSECHRVLKPKGVMIFTVPFSARWHYIPADYWRFTPSGLKRLLEKAGFRQVSVWERGTDINVALYKISSLCFRWISFAGKPFQLRMLALLFWIPLTLLSFVVVSANWAVYLCRIGSKDDTLGYTVRCRK